MPRSLSLGNGNVLVLLDKYGQLRDFYFPYVGLENHVGSHFMHRVGVYVDNKMSWTNEPSWQVNYDYEDESLEGYVKAVNNELNIELEFRDVVYNEKNIFIRKVIVTNKANDTRRIKVFFSQEFELYDSHRGDTAYYDPTHQAIVHYKGRRVFLVNAICKDKGFDDYSVGLFGIEGKEGSHRDADDGVLSKSAIEHGQVDSIIGITMDIASHISCEIYYWIIATKSLRETINLNNYIINKTPEYLMISTRNFWHAWVNKQNIDFTGIDQQTIDMYKKSLIVIRTHIDNEGSILASGDSDLLQYGRDTYGYMWPRDSALTALAIDKAGYLNLSKRYFEFSNDIITDDGYFLQKYRPDKSLGATWHPWIRDGKPELPIQEDETALTIYALWKHYEKSKDLEFIESVYNSMLKPAAEFMTLYIDFETGLPKPSYDLWEEKFGSHTFTSAATYAALIGASKFANILGKSEAQERYMRAAEKIKAAVLKHLYDEEKGYFYKMATMRNGVLEFDKTIDMSSIYGVFKFGLLPIDDERIARNIQVVEQHLRCKTEVGGIARYEGDNYFRIANDYPGNPWIITTLWVAQYYIATAKTIEELEVQKKWFKWAAKYAQKSGIMSEQLDPFTGAQLSATPLTWSHGEFIVTVLEYLDKYKELSRT